MKKIFSLFAVVFMAIGMFAETVTFTFKTDTDITITQNGTISTGGDFSLSKAGVTLSGTTGYFEAVNSNKTLIVYKTTGTLVVTAPANALISQVDFSYNGKVYPLVEAPGEDARDENGKFTASGAHAASYLSLIHI